MSVIDAHDLNQPLDAIALAASIRNGETTAREVVDEAIARIEKHDPALNAVIATRFDEALAEVDAGLPDGPLRGVPVLVKDLNMDVAGLPSTRGSRLFAEHVPDRDSELVARYKRAGMVVLGTTNSPEFGLNASTEPQLHGPTHNPRDLTRSPGGSSGGSAAAVAAGLVPVAHASDGGGSIRIPASMNGLFGLKPSRGRVTSAPAPSTLSGPASVHHAVTTTVRDSALLLDISSARLPGTAIGVPTPAQSFATLAAQSPRPLRIALATAFADGPETDPEVLAIVERAAALCESLGHTVVPIEAPWVPGEVSAETAPLMGIAFTVAVQDRLAVLGRELLDDDLEPFTRQLFEHYRALPATALSRSLSAAQRIGWEVGATFEQYDVLLTPTVARRVPPLGLLDTTHPESIYQHAATFSAWTSVFNATGMPAMSVPLGTDSDGLPVGVQFAADLGEEGLLLSLAGQLEAAAPWARTV
ncbi:amidase [Nocardioides sp. Root140]|uniref:amidase n=1 Tax=Nocardioides sp. Root140 TaxID=1736460 RepID=UPI0006FEA148|nr:amidase family protein [Nocardioides sp. Root140]KQY50977.1 6-aminohexanoate hydrolase [Nocardioides sp. Root140]